LLKISLSCWGYHLVDVTRVSCRMVYKHALVYILLVGWINLYLVITFVPLWNVT